MLPGIVREDGIRKTMQVRFGGYDRRVGHWDGTWSNTLRLSPELSPLVGARSAYSYQDNDTSYVFGTDTRIEIRNDGEIWYDGWKLGFFTQQDERRRAVRFGKDWIIWPDKVLLRIGTVLKGRVAAAAALEQIEDPAEGDVWTVGEAQEGNPYLYTYTGGSWVQGERVMQELEAAVTIPAEQAQFVNGYYAGVNGAKMNTIRASGTIWADYFRVGDAVEISGCTVQPLNNQTLTIREIEGGDLRFHENSFHGKPVYMLQLKGSMPATFQDGGVAKPIWYYAYADDGFPDAAIYFKLPADLVEGDDILYDPEDPGALSVHWNEGGSSARIQLQEEEPEWGMDDTRMLVRAAFTKAEDSYYSVLIEHSPVTVARKLPDMDFIFCDSNRLWGCKGSVIYASALGDPSVFYRFDGLSDDSWSTEVFSPGAFTGAISHDGYPTFFKEKIRYKIFGAQPSAYQLSETNCDGVKEGCSESLAIVDSTLFYLSPLGVMADSGAVPSCISRELGQREFSDACAGVWERRYVISMQDRQQVWRVFLYDTEKGIWLRDEDRRYRNFATIHRVLYATEYRAQGGGKLIRFDGQGTLEDWTDEGTVESMAETNEFFMDNPNRKRIHRVQLRLLVGQESTLTVKVKYDSESEWRTVRTLGEGKLQSYYLPVRLRRCDHFRLRFEGTGEWTMFSMTLETVGGSAIH
jgi:hypothetical protein